MLKEHLYQEAKYYWLVPWKSLAKPLHSSKEDAVFVGGTDEMFIVAKHLNDPDFIMETGDKATGRCLLHVHLTRGECEQLVSIAAKTVGKKDELKVN